MDYSGTYRTVSDPAYHGDITVRRATGERCGQYDYEYMTKLTGRWNGIAGNSTAATSSIQGCLDARPGSNPWRLVRKAYPERVCVPEGL